MITITLVTITVITVILIVAELVNSLLQNAICITRIIDIGRNNFSIMAVTVVTVIVDQGHNKS